MYKKGLPTYFSACMMSETLPSFRSNIIGVFQFFVLSKYSGIKLSTKQNVRFKRKCHSVFFMYASGIYLYSTFSTQTKVNMSHITRKPAFRSLQPGKTQTSLPNYRNEQVLKILGIATIGIILSRQ